VGQILAWADAHFARTGRWPKCTDRHVFDDLNEKWCNLDQALRDGCRGLLRGSSLPQVLAEHRGVRNIADLPVLTEDIILAWADAHFARTGDWPRTDTGPVIDSPGDVWITLDASLNEGRRGLPGGSSLAQLLQQRRGVRYHLGLPKFTAGQILRWAKAHRRQTGRWPRVQDGPIADAPDETWLAVDTALREGLRGLPGGSSLAQLMAERLGVRNKASPPRLTLTRILAWADAYHRRTGRWPGQASGPIHDAPGETWAAVERSLQGGQRGLPGGSSIAQLLAARRGVRNPARPPRLNIKQIRKWMAAHRRRTGRWPGPGSGPIEDAPGETWAAVNAALREALRGLPGGSSLTLLRQ
jgi:hypothetical protein